ncbi:MAG: SH3 domain-containing protein [Chloroflexi bacterium]|nr:SH3 domain-containing protein [Chloroflexota bacterium]
MSWVQITAVPLPVPLPTTGSWRAEYFNNTVLAGEPALVRNDARLNFNWGSGSPAPNIINTDGFSVRWSQTFNMAAGTYQLTAEADDGIRVWVNGQQVIDRWQIQAVAQHTAVINHSGGQLVVMVEYFENTGFAEARLDWAQVGTTPTPPTTQGATATMTGASYLNVRSGPGLEHEPFAALSRNQTVPVVGCDAYGIWLEIQLPDGNTGWVSSRYLTTTTPVVDLPITG